MELAQDFVAFESGQLAQLQAHDRIGLAFCHAVFGQGAQLALQSLEAVVAQGAAQHGCRDGHAGQAGLRLLAVGGRSADGDHLVERADGDELAFEHMAAFFGFFEQVLGASADHLDSVLEEALDEVFDG